MILGYSLGLLATITLIAGGCSNIQRFDLPRDHENIPSVRTIVQRVKCELATVAAEDYEYKRYIDDGDYVIAIELNIEVANDGSLTPALTYTNGAFSFNAAGKFEISRDQQFTEQLFFSISDIRDTMKADRIASERLGRKVNSFECPAPDTNLAGDLGIVDSVHMAFLSDGLNTQAKLSGAKGAFGGYINFVVTKNLNAVGPTYTLTRLKGPGSLLTLSEVNTDKLTFAFAQRSATGDLPPGPARLRVATKPLIDGDAKNRAIGLLSSIQTSQIASQLAGIRVNTR